MYWPGAMCGIGPGPGVGPLACWGIIPIPPGMGGLVAACICPPLPYPVSQTLQIWSDSFWTGNLGIKLQNEGSRLEMVKKRLSEKMCEMLNVKTSFESIFLLPRQPSTRLPEGRKGVQNCSPNLMKFNVMTSRKHKYEVNFLHKNQHWRTDHFFVAINIF